MRTRRSKMKCKKTLRKNSKLPRYEARTCPDKIKKGKDGKYKSVERSDGVWIWQKL